MLASTYNINFKIFFFGYQIKYNSRKKKMRNPNKNSKTNPLNHTVLPQKANNHTQSYKQQTNSNKWLMFRRNPKFWIQITSRNKMQLVLRTWEIITVDAASFQILQSQEPSRIEIKKNIEQLLNRYELNSTSFQNETFRIVKLNNNWSLRTCKEKKKKKSYGCCCWEIKL